MFHQLIKEKYNMSHAYNYGIGGTRIARQLVPTKERTKLDLTFELRAEIMDRNSDAVVVFGGTNDYGHGDAPFGDIDSDSDDIYTFCGAVNSLITKLQKDFKDKKIVFMTPLHRRDEMEHTDVIIEYDKEPRVKPNSDFKIKFTLSNRRRDARHFYVKVMLPEGWSADYDRCVYVPFNDEHHNDTGINMTTYEMVVHVGEKVDATNDIVVSFSNSAAHAVPMLVPVVLLG